MSMPLRRRVRRFALALMRALARRVGRGGMPRLARVGEALGGWHFRLSPVKRRRLLAQMRSALNHPDSLPEMSSCLRTAYQVNDRGILEILAMYEGAVGPRQVAESVAIDGIEHLDDALEAGRGVVLLGMHMGNGVAMATRLAWLGYPVSVVYREAGKIEPGFFRDGITGLGMQAVSAEPPASGFRNMAKTLRANGILFILMDQASKRGGIEADFLGKTLPMPSGPAELARRTGSAVLPVLLEGARPGWHFRIGAPAGVDPDRPVAETVADLTWIMQTHVRKHPQWWTWHQRRWWRYPFDHSTNRSDRDED